LIAYSRRGIGRDTGRAVNIRAHVVIHINVHTTTSIVIVRIILVIRNSSGSLIKGTAWAWARAGWGIGAAIVVGQRFIPRIIIVTSARDSIETNRGWT